jgi:hypothetical protein
MERSRRNTREEERIKKLEWEKGSERRQNLREGRDVKRKIENIIVRCRKKYEYIVRGKDVQRNTKKQKERGLYLSIR